MKREDLIKKWLDNELSSQELEAFKQLQDYEDLVKLSSAITQFKAEPFNSDAELERLNKTINVKTKKQNNWFKPLMRIAAILTICFGYFYYTSTLDTNVITLAAQKNVIELPDASSVNLNTASSISYNKNKWEENREVKLSGEAYFKVAKGSKFSVKTNTGLVTVLGTQFNVKDRKNLFEVVCYEGSVKVTHNETIVILKPGNSFLIIDEVVVNKGMENQITPSWINNESTFKSMPFKNVLAEFERQHNVTFNAKDIDLTQIFTGSFSHKDLDLALKSITLPLNLSYIKDKRTITLKSE